MNYSLGYGREETIRLARQLALYGDTQGMCFNGDSRVCEFGCGTGANLWIAEQLTKGAYVGIDINAAQIEQAQERVVEKSFGNAEFYVADAGATDFPDASFDAVFCRCLLIHQPFPESIISEMVRVLRPGGRVVISEPRDRSYYCGPGKTTLLKCFRARSEYAYDNGRGAPDLALGLREMLVSAGLRRVHVRPHVVSCGTHDDPQRCRQLLENWIAIIEAVGDELVDSNRISQRELDDARREAVRLDAHTFLFQVMWIAEALK